MSPHTFVFAGILIVQTRLYAQSTLTSLNMRSSNRQLLNTSPVAYIMERSSLIGKRSDCEELRHEPELCENGPHFSGMTAALHDPRHSVLMGPIYYRPRTDGFKDIEGQSEVQEHAPGGMSQSQMDEHTDYY